VVSAISGEPLLARGSKPRDGRDTLGRYYNYPSAGWLKTAYDAAGAWQTLKSDVEDIKSFDETPATMLHLIMRKG
jgi:hypothetical protein